MARLCSQNPNKEPTTSEAVRRRVKEGGAISAVVWLDATKRDDLKPGDPPEPELGVTVGFVIQRTKRKVVVAGEFFADGHVRDVTTIPTRTVLGVFEIGFFKVPKDFWKFMERPPDA